MQNLSQQAASWLIGVPPRTLRERQAPRNDDGTYDGSKLVAWNNPSETTDRPGNRLNDQLLRIKIRKERETLVKTDDIRHALDELAGLLRDLGETFATQPNVSGADAQRMLNDVITSPEWTAFL